MTSKLNRQILRVLPASILSAIAGVAGAQTTTPGTTVTPGVPTTALGGFAGEAILMSVFALALILIASIIAYKAEVKKTS